MQAWNEQPELDALSAKLFRFAGTLGAVLLIFSLAYFVPEVISAVVGK